METLLAHNFIDLKNQEYKCNHKRILLSETGRFILIAESNLKNKMGLLKSTHSLCSVSVSRG